MQSPTLGRYSYMASDPVACVRIDKPQADPLARIRELLLRCQSERIPELPPMQGGWMGWFGYELGGCFERVRPAQHDDFQLPLAALGMYDVVLSWDHQTGQGWLVSQGWPEPDPRRRQERAYRRLQEVYSVLEQSLGSLQSPPDNSFFLPERLLAQQFPTRWSERWTSNFSAQRYREAVAKCVEYIHAGDVFQVNLSQRLLGRAWANSPELYLHLRKRSPAPFNCYADFGRTQIVSTSPERFISLQAGELETRPIKGTRPRLSDPTADAGMAQLLQESVKDRSENVMIVDLLRNDLSRIAEPNSVRVDALCSVERYAFVWHLVSVIKAQLGQTFNASDVVESTFPGGSITGAPKIRAMEIISELEPTPRGPYCGSMGYLSFAGDMDLNILIRTLTACSGWWQIPVGGGIVASSDPHLEEQETWHKAEGILRALDTLHSQDRRWLLPRGNH